MTAERYNVILHFGGQLKGNITKADSAPSSIAEVITELWEKELQPTLDGLAQALKTVCAETTIRHDRGSLSAGISLTPAQAGDLARVPDIEKLIVAIFLDRSAKLGLA